MKYDTPRIDTGRRMAGRPTEKKAYCPSCDARMVWGEPSTNGSWHDRLRLSDEQIDLLIVAAAEFDALSRESGDESWVVAFCDWIRPDVEAAA